MENKLKITVKDICYIAALTAILVVQEFALSFLPNIQLTILLLMIYSRVLGFKKTLLILLIYIPLDSILIGSFNPLLMLSQLFGWIPIPILMCLVFKKTTNNFILALISVLFAFLYSWILIFPSSKIMEINIINYLEADIVFELLLAGSSFLSVLLLFNPIANALNKIFKKEAN